MPVLDPYVHAVLNDQDRELLQEASAALEAGATRVAYIGVWLSIAESLRRKFVEMAPRDHVAGSHLRDIEAREAQHRAVDAVLIEKAEDYGFVSDAEATRLKHVYENRSIFGHPYEQRPTAELILAAAADGVEIVLGRETQLRHGYLQEQVRRITGDVAFVDDADAAIDDYAKGVHRRSAQDLRLWFLRGLWEDLEPLYADQSLDLFHRRGEQFTVTFIREDPSMLNSWDPVADIPAFPRVLSNVFAVPDLFDELGQHGGDIVVGLLVLAAATHSKAVGQVYELLQVANVTTRQEERLQKALDGASLSRLAAARLPIRAFVPKLVEDLSSHNWYSQNPAAAALLSAGPNGLSGIPDDDLRLLGRNVAQAADGTAGEAERLVGALADGGDWPSSFVEGIVLEAFVHESGAIRFKDRYLNELVRTALGVADRERSNVIATVVSEIENGHPRDPWRFARDRAANCDRIRAEAANPALADLEHIAAALEAVQIDPEDLPS